MKTTKTFLQKMIRLSYGEQIPKSSLKGELLLKMVNDGAIIMIPHGSKGYYAAKDIKSFRNYLNGIFNTDDLEALAEMMGKNEVSRAEQTRLTGNSKTKRQRTFKGFLVNCYDPIKAKLGNREITINPETGTFTFIYEYESFQIPPEIVVIGVENSENFRFIERQKYLFDKFLKPDERVIFVNRYPTDQTDDLRKWLMAIPNKYIHFGDLDLKGVDIYLNTFFTYLGEKSSFLIPNDAEERIRSGDSNRYNVQYRPNEGKTKDPRVQPLLDLIHKYHKGYDQEGFIE